MSKSFEKWQDYEEESDKVFYTDEDSKLQKTPMKIPINMKWLRKMSIQIETLIDN